MPTYEYECGACRHRFEKFQPITSQPVRTCPKCGKRRAKRLLGSGGALIFKGSGFYSTDYRSSSYKTAAKGDKEPPAAAKDVKDASAKPKPKPASGSKEG